MDRTGAAEQEEIRSGCLLRLLRLLLLLLLLLFLLLRIRVGSRARKHKA
jgi:hypothetical protein